MERDPRQIGSLSEAELEAWWGYDLVRFGQDVAWLLGCIYAPFALAAVCWCFPALHAVQLMLGCCALGGASALLQMPTGCCLPQPRPQS